MWRPLTRKLIPLSVLLEGQEKGNVMKLSRTLILTTPYAVAVFEVYLDWFGEFLGATLVYHFDVHEVSAGDDRNVIDTEGHDSDCACPSCEAEVLRDMDGEPIWHMEPAIGFLQPEPYLRLVN